MYLVNIILTFALLVSNVMAKSSNLDHKEVSDSKDMSIEFSAKYQEPINGRLIHSDENFYFFQVFGDKDAPLHVVSRLDVQYLNTNMDIDLQLVLESNDPQDMIDVIEMNDGTKILCIILDVGLNSIQYFTGKSMKREIVSTNSVYMVYMDDASTSIPFPVPPANLAVL